MQSLLYMRKENQKVYCSSPPVAEALSFTITRPISSPSWIIFHSHYQSSIFCSIVTRAHFETCAGLRVLAPWRACQAQPFHSSWFIGWAHFLLCCQERLPYNQHLDVHSENHVKEPWDCSLATDWEIKHSHDSDESFYYLTLTKPLCSAADRQKSRSNTGARGRASTWHWRQETRRTKLLHFCKSRNVVHFL